MEKVCSKCLIKKDYKEFNKNRTNKDGLSYWCKKCISENYKKNSEKVLKQNKEYRLKNIEKIKELRKQGYIRNIEKIRKQQKEYYKKNPEKIKTKVKEYRIKNLEKIKIYESINKEHKNEVRRIHRIKNKDRINSVLSKYRKKRRKEDINYKLSCLLRTRLNDALKDNCKSDRTKNLIGCNVEKLKKHLQQTAIKNGYLNFNINNYDSKKFHIDHIVPCVLFNFKCSYHQRLCFNYTNLQILTSKENCKKLKSNYYF